MVTVECTRTGCTKAVDVGAGLEWCELSPRLSWDPFGDAGEGFGARLVVALPEGWVVERIASGDEVIHCPEHAGA